jgi:hypothetical protein
MKHWNNLTIEDYQHIYGIIVDESLNDFDKEVKLVALVNELTEEEVDNLPIDKFKSMKDSLNFLNDGKIEGKLKSIIKANGNKYQISLDAFKITYGQYVDLTSFMGANGGLVGNLHLVMASLAMPVKRNWLGIPYVDGYGSKPHNEVADDMLKANFADCHNTCIFFCKLINDLTKVTVRYSVKEILKSKKVTKEKLREILKPLKQDGGGYIMPNLLKDLKELV